MPTKTCKTCGGLTNTVFCDWAEHDDYEPRKCYLRFENGVLVKGCGWDSLDRLGKYGKPLYSQYLKKEE